MTCEYNEISTYLLSKQSVVEKIKAIDELINLMIAQIADHVAGSAVTISEYNLDDGQVKLRTSYRSITEVTNGVKNLEHIRQIHINQFNGRGVVLRDIKAFRR